MAETGIGLWTAVLGIACALAVSASRAEELADKFRPLPSTRLRLTCHISGGGYAIKGTDGRMLENGDGAPFPPGPPIVLLVMALPRHIRVAEGDLPYPKCPSAPLLDSFSPIRFTWCQAQYHIEAQDAGDYLLRSTSRWSLETGPHRGDIMEAFLVGTCVAAGQ